MLRFPYCSAVATAAGRRARRVALALMVLVPVLATPVAPAQALGIGVSLTSTDFMAFGPEVEAVSGTGVNVSIGTAVAADVTAEVEMIFAQGVLSSLSGGSLDAGSGIGGFIFDVNVRYAPPLFGKIVRPYVGVGMGYGVAGFNSSTAAGETVTAEAYGHIVQAEAGLQVVIGRFSLGAGYRALGFIDDFVVEYSSVDGSRFENGRLGIGMISTAATIVF